MINNQIKISGLFGLCRYIAVVFGVILLSTWTVKSAPSVNSTKQVLQQNIYKEITGTVKTQDGDPIPGAVVLKVGTNQGTDTDIDGRYSLNVNEGDKIQFVYDGFKTTTVTVSKSNILNITMIEDDSEMLSSIEITNCYPSTVSKENTCTFPNRNNNLLLTLQGQLVSLNITKSSENIPRSYDPSERKPETILKDVENLTRNGNYTYIVDGVRVSEETFRSLNQNDVESVDIYKHTDVYNARFGNKENQSKISLNAP